MAFLGKLIDWGIEWVKEKWPRFPLPFPIIGYLIIKSYFDLSYQEAFWHWLVWLITGVSILTTGICYWIYSAQKKLSSLWPGKILTSAGILIILLCLLPKLVNIWFLTLPQDRLVVSISRFTPISESASVEADNFPHRIEQALIAKQKKGATLDIKRLSAEATGTDEGSRHDAARAMGRSWKGCAHLVLWGEVREEEGELYIKPYLTIANELREAKIQTKDLAHFVTYDPKNIEFKERAAKGIADIVTFIYGLSYYKSEKWAEAIEVFDDVGTDKGQLYSGLSFYHKAQQSDHPQKDLTSSIKIFEQTLSPSPLSPDDKVGSLRWRAHLNRAHALIYSGFHSEPKEALGFFDNALQAYRNALNFVPQSEEKRAWDGIMMNIGIAYYGRSSRSKGKEINQYLSYSINSFRQVLDADIREDFPEFWALTQSNLGIALRKLGNRLVFKEGVKYLKDSVKAHCSALEVYRKYKYPEDWARVKNNLGNSLSGFGKRLGWEKGNKVLRDGVKAYEDALKIRTKEKYPQDWASVKNNIGATLHSLGIRSGHKEQRKFFQKSLKAYRDALQVYTKTDFPQRWIGLQNNVGNVLTDLGVIEAWEKGKEFLFEAITTYRSALTSISPENSPQEWPYFLFGLGRALHRLGIRLPPDKRNKTLIEARQVLDKSMKGFTRIRSHKMLIKTMAELNSVMSDMVYDKVDWGKGPPEWAKDFPLQSPAQPPETSTISKD